MDNNLNKVIFNPAMKIKFMLNLILSVPKIFKILNKSQKTLNILYNTN